MFLLLHKLFDVVAIGELLIDFTPAGKSASGNVQFEQNPGGAPANVAAAVALWGQQSAFIGKVGDDPFGHFLNEALSDVGIDCSGLIYADDSNTTLAFVHLDESGDRSFSFHRKPGADSMLRMEEVNLTLIDTAAIFHFGTVSMTKEPARSATLMAAKYASDKGVSVSFDPNLRMSLWTDSDEAKQAMEEGLRIADIVKLSEEELEFLFRLQEGSTGGAEVEAEADGEAEADSENAVDIDGSGAAGIERYVHWLMERYPTISLLLITLGARGCYYKTSKHEGSILGYSANVVDTTGAGDVFLGGVLYQINEKKLQLSDLSKEEIEYAVDFANAAASLTVTKRGAIPAIPSLEEIDRRIRSY